MASRTNPNSREESVPVETVRKERIIRASLDHDPIESAHDLISLFEHDLRANASRLSRGKTGSHFSGSCSSAKTRFALLPGHDGSNIQGAERLLDCGQRLLRSGMFMSSILSSRTGSSTAQARFGSTLTLK